jgi:arylsulfatase A-like enzyme
MALPAATELATAQGTAERRPNVILIMTDDQSYADFGWAGNPIVKTPHIDKLHGESLRFTDFHVSPTCSPTRASLMTGRYCNRTGVWHTIMGRSLLRKDEVTMADVFGASGYRTGIFGKWHLGDNYPFRPEDRGFQEVLVHKGGGVGQGLDHWGNDYFDDTYFHNGVKEEYEGYCTDIWFDGAMEFIEDKKDQPFFCFIPTNAAHGPFFVADEYSQPYKDQGVESPLAEFYGMITNIDDNMGRLEAHLDRLGLRDDTIVVFMTDNGGDPAGDGEKYNGDMRSFKGSMYEGGHRVPCFFRWPGGGLGGGRDIGELSAHIDILPTLTDLCGMPRPAGVDIDGQSLLPLLTKENGAWPDRTIITDSQRVDHPIKWRRSSTMKGSWRLISGEELYDISTDPGQENDIAEAHADVVKALRADYEDWWDDTSTRFGEYCEIILGAPEENPTCLMSHDVHGKVVWNHGMVTRAERGDGFWAVDVAVDGAYEFELRRWPVEVDEPITAAAARYEGDEPRGDLVITDARLKIAHFDETLPVAPDATEVTFRLKLKAGKTRCQAWFINGLGDGTTHGAYYVYVKRV